MRNLRTLQKFTALLVYVIFLSLGNPARAQHGGHQAEASVVEDAKGDAEVSSTGPMQMASSDGAVVEFSLAFVDLSTFDKNSLNKCLPDIVSILKQRTLASSNLVSVDKRKKALESAFRRAIAEVVEAKRISPFLKKADPLVESFVIKAK